MALGYGGAALVSRIAHRQPDALPARKARRLLVGRDLDHVLADLLPDAA